MIKNSYDTEISKNGKLLTSSLSFADELGGSMARKERDLPENHSLRNFELPIKSTVNYVHQTLKHDVEFTLEREIETETERQRKRITPLVHKFCLQTLPSILNREEW